jgi:hypothetical protein
LRTCRLSISRASASPWSLSGSSGCTNVKVLMKSYHTRLGPLSICRSQRDRWSVSHRWYYKNQVDLCSNSPCFGPTLVCLASRTNTTSSRSHQSIQRSDRCTWCHPFAYRKFQDL